MGPGPCGREVGERKLLYLPHLPCLPGLKRFNSRAGKRLEDEIFLCPFITRTGTGPSRKCIIAYRRWLRDERVFIHM
jgi:hypothetical protein